MAESDDLISFIASAAGEENLRIEESFGDGFVRLRVAEAERRQAKQDIRFIEDAVVELLRNARDAGATALFVASFKTGETRTIVCIDNGSGVPEAMRKRIFDARVTSKLETMRMDQWGVHGRGMALYSIRHNALEAYVVSTMVNGGTAISVSFDTNSLSERADQSTWPVLGKDDDGEPCCVKGPRNIIRTVAEFALAERNTCAVYLGTPTEIAATLYERSLGAEYSAPDSLLADPASLALCDRIGAAADAADFVSIARTLGLELSERTAQRIMAGRIPALPSVASRLLATQERADERRVDLARDRRGLKIASDDAAEFQEALEKAFEVLGEKYYLELQYSPRVRVAGDRITVTFDIDKGE